MQCNRIGCADRRLIKKQAETANCYLDETYVGGLAEPVAHGQYVLMAVADMGVGMDRDTLEKAFEPFFTTKDVSMGTGLGLSQVYGFIRQSAGHVKIYSEAGEGTTVKIYLPRHIGDHGAARPDDTEGEAVRAIGIETILVVEDDDALRAYTTEILRELGYFVVEAASGAAALESLAKHRVDLLFTDVVMPGGVNGRRLSDEALRRWPGLKVLFTTGYTRNAIVHHGPLDPGIHLIGKPFSFQQLAARVRSRLDAAD